RAAARDELPPRCRPWPRVRPWPPCPFCAFCPLWLLSCPSVPGRWPCACGRGASCGGGNGRNASEPLNVHVTVANPNIKPRMVFQRFCPRYGMLLGAPAKRYFRDGEYIHTPTIIPMIAAPTPTIAE